MWPFVFCASVFCAFVFCAFVFFSAFVLSTIAPPHDACLYSATGVIAHVAEAYDGLATLHLVVSWNVFLDLHLPSKGLTTTRAVKAYRAFAALSPVAS